MAVSSLELARFKRLAVRSADVWQGGIVRLPAWIQEKEDDPPYRSMGAFWFSTRTGLAWVAPELVPNTAGVDLAVQGLVGFAKKYADQLLGRPSRIEVTDTAFADSLRDALADDETTIAVVKDLPNVRDALRAFEAYQNDSEAMPASLLESPGVTIDRVRGFADAAARFYRADLWHAFQSDEDLVVVESPVVDPALSHFVITGSTRDVRGLSFFASPDQFARFLANPPGPGRRKPSIWILSFDPIDWLPFGDVDAWIDHDLPVAAPDAYPRPGLIEGINGLARPDGARLTFLEAVLRALAESSDEEMDSGRWTRRVDTADGPVEVRLALPLLLAAVAREASDAEVAAPARSTRPLDARMDLEQAMHKARQAVEAAGATSLEEVKRIIESVVAAPPAERARRDPHAPPPTPLEQAQALAYAAMQESGRYQVQLARRALALSRDCADAWMMLGDRAASVEAALPLYREAVEAGARALGPAFFEVEAGHFWGLIETRGYMRARFALAEALEDAGARDDAIAHYQELLRLNPNDNQGARDPLLVALLSSGRDADAQVLVAQFDDDARAFWAYGGALAAFLAGADDEGRTRLARALTANRHVPPFLTGEKAIPDLPASYRIGSIEEATIVADQLLDVWTEAPGAVFWLNTERRLKAGAAKGKLKKKERG